MRGGFAAPSQAREQAHDFAVNVFAAGVFVDGPLIQTERIFRPPFSQPNVRHFGQRFKITRLKIGTAVQNPAVAVTLQERPTIQVDRLLPRRDSVRIRLSRPSSRRVA